MAQSAALRILFGLFILLGVGLYICHMVEPQAPPPVETAAPLLALNAELDTPAQLAGWHWQAEDGYTGYVTLDTTEKATGAAAARLSLSEAGGSGWKASFSYAPVQVDFGEDYTLTFWARADRSRPLSAWIQGRGSAPETWLLFSDVTVSTEWQQFELTAHAGRSDALAGLYFGLGQAPGTVWLDRITLAAGSH